MNPLFCTNQKGLKISVYLLSCSYIFELLVFVTVVVCVHLFVFVMRLQIYINTHYYDSLRSLKLTFNARCGNKMAFSAYEMVMWPTEV